MSSDVTKAAAEIQLSGREILKADIAKRAVQMKLLAADILDEQIPHRGTQVDVLKRGTLWNGDGDILRLIGAGISWPFVGQL